MITIAITAFLGNGVLTEGAAGSQGDPIEIGTAAELKSFAKRVNEGEVKLCAKLTTDIVLNDETFTLNPDTGLVKVTDGTNIAYLGTGIKGDKSGENGTFDAEESVPGQWYGSETSRDEGSYSGICETWTPIGIMGEIFNGTFDGQGFTVSGVYINERDSTSMAGFVEYLSGTVKDVGVVNSYVKGVSFVGGVVGLSYGTVTRCYNMGIVIGEDYVGGITGDNSNSLSYCYNTGIVIGKNYVGGITGDNSNSLSYCHNTGVVIGENYVSGITGDNSNSLSYCYNTGIVIGEIFVGGIVGWNGTGSVSNCYNVGTIFGLSDDGGIAGGNDDRITSCYYLGTEDDGTIGSTAMTAAQFASGEVAWLLNTMSGTEANSKVFAQGVTSPEFATTENREILRLRFFGAKDASVYLAAGEVLPALSELVEASWYEEGVEIEQDSEVEIYISLASARPIITDSIAIEYTAIINDAFRGGATPVMKFSSHSEVTEVDGVRVKEDGGYATYTFTFRDIYPQFMSENISAVLTVGNATVSKSNYSIRDYALRMLDSTKEEMGYTEEKCEAFKKLLVDMLYYGTAAQRYKAEQLNGTVEDMALATYGLKSEHEGLRTDDKTSEAASVTTCVTPSEGAYTAYEWYSATFVLTDRISLRFKFNAPDLTDLKVKANLGGMPHTIEDFVPTGTDGQYMFDFTKIAASQLGESIDLQLYKGDTPTGSTLRYSINSYIASERDSATPALYDLLRSIYGYELTVKAFSEYPQ